MTREQKTEVEQSLRLAFDEVAKLYSPREAFALTQEFLIAYTWERCGATTPEEMQDSRFPTPVFKLKLERKAIDGDKLD